ncbi:phage minor head protein [Roseovarius sp. MMSF_3281]|uniref:phage minor head protein n=1 Tax=Roseovarius sp. MMSF_3281 TaxID=3046694 RepID=UPI00273DD226|nr:phage minor head protein [Roseovarius sp. MMSF_3281]
MAKRETLAQIADRLEPSVRRAFLDSVQNIKSDVQLNLLIEAIAANDTARVIQLLNLERAYFAPLDRGLTQAYQEAGDAIMAAWMAEASAAGVQARAMFDARNPRAEEWLRTQSSRLITEIIEDQRESVRQLLVANIEKGTSPRTTALDLVGRVNRATGKREGGIVGLHSGDAANKARALSELRSGDPAAMRNYLTRKTRDKRFDGIVRRAIRDGKPVPAEKARKMMVGMENRMLRNRGEAIARTELLGSTHAAQDEGLDQMIEDGKLSAQNVSGEWDASEDGATRDSHRAMDGQVRRHGEAFVTGAGYRMMRPGDRSLGAPAKEIINCRCVKRIDIDWIAQAAMESRAA